jgi:hypothetical protein
VFKNPPLLSNKATGFGHTMIIHWLAQYGMWCIDMIRKSAFKRHIGRFRTHQFSFCLAHNPKVVGSSPAPATLYPHNKLKNNKLWGFLFLSGTIYGAITCVVIIL